MRCLQSVEAVRRGRDFKLAIFKGEFGNLCVVLGAWGALFGAVAATNYFGHDVVRLVTENAPVPQASGISAPVLDDVVAHMDLTKFSRANSPLVSEVTQADLSKDIVYQRLLLEQPDLKKRLAAKRPRYISSTGPVFYYARANAFKKMIGGDYQAAKEMFDLAARQPDQSHMCGDPKSALQIEHDLALLSATTLSIKDPGSAARLFHEPDTFYSSFAWADLSELSGDPGMFITYLQHGFSSEPRAGGNSQSERLMKSRALALTGELNPAERAKVNAICNTRIAENSSSVPVAQFLAATGQNEKAVSVFKSALSSDSDREKVFALYQHYKNTQQWYQAYDFALEGSRLEGVKRLPYVACLVDFYLRLEQRPKWRNKVLGDNPALAVELKNDSWKNGLYDRGCEALLGDLETWTTEQSNGLLFIPWTGEGPKFLCTPLLQNLIAWCKVENLEQKVVPLLNINLGIAKTYGTAGDVVNALSLLADYYNSKGDSARADKYNAALVKAATTTNNRVIGLGGGLWINDLSIEQLSKAWTTPAEKIAIISALKRSRDNAVHEFGANSLQEMMQIRYAAHFLLACGDGGESTHLSSKAWAMALKGKNFPIEERRRVLADYIAGLKATKNEKVAEKLAPLLAAISEQDSQ